MCNLNSSHIYTHTRTYINLTMSLMSENQKNDELKACLKKKPSLVIGKEASIASYLGISEEG